MDYTAIICNNRDIFLYDGIEFINRIWVRCVLGFEILKQKLFIVR